MRKGFDGFASRFGQVHERADRRPEESHLGGVQLHDQQGVVRLVDLDRPVDFGWVQLRMKQERGKSANFCFSDQVFARENYSGFLAVAHLFVNHQGLAEDHGVVVARRANPRFAAFQADRKRKPGQAQERNNAFVSATRSIDEQRRQKTEIV